MSTYKLDKKALDDYILSSGSWPDILSGLGGFTDAVQTIGSSKKYDCPFPENHKKSHGKKKFRFLNPKSGEFRGNAICSCGAWDGYELLMEDNGWTFYQCLEEINTFLHNPLNIVEKDADPKAQAEAKARAEKLRIERAQKAEAARQELARKTAREDEFIKTLITDTWKEGMSVLSEEARPLWKYLANRGITPNVLKHVGANLRFHPNLEYRDEDKKLIGTSPALMAIFRDSLGRPATFHRIYMTPEGVKYAPDDSGAKKMMPRPSKADLSGGAIRLGDINPGTRVLGIAEGIETALAVYAATGITTWASYSAGLLKQFEANAKDIDLLIIWADKDASETGIEAARALKMKAWEMGIRCQVELPPMPIPEGEKSVDWNDVLRFRGPSAFPKPNKFFPPMHSKIA